ncbi:MAG: nucleotidyltransferase domain-containing protein [Polyangiaceae bacterium]
MSADGYALVGAHAAEVARAFLATEETHRRHLVIALSGAHAYGFPSPDSDLDLKAVHVDRTARLLGLEAAPTGASRMEVVLGVELDYSSNEIGAVLGGILQGNGNYLERILGAPILAAAPELTDLQPVVRRSLSKRVYRHYRGFAAAQRRELVQKRTIKRLLYVLRTATTGLHLLRTGEVVPDLSLLADEYGLAEAAHLIELKRAGEAAALPDGAEQAWAERVDALFGALDEALATSLLPDDPPNRAEVDAWLVALRRADLLRS